MRPCEVELLGVMTPLGVMDLTASHIVTIVVVVGETSGESTSASHGHDFVRTSCNERAR
jgi:hypothetical protein